MWEATVDENHCHSWGWRDDGERDYYQSPKVGDAWWVLESRGRSHIVGVRATARAVQRDIVREEKYLVDFLLL